MSKFCENCGAEINDDVTVCPNCNTPVGGATVEPKAEEPVNTASTSAGAKADTKKLAIIGGGIAAAVVVILAIIIGIVSGRYKAPIKKYVKGMNKCDSKSYAAAYPDFMKMDSVTDDALKSQKKDAEKKYGDNVKYSVKILKKTKVSKDDLKSVKEYIKKQYDKDVKVSKGFKVKVKATIKGKDDYRYYTEDEYVYKVDGKWCLLDISPESAKKYTK